MLMHSLMGCHPRTRHRVYIGRRPNRHPSDLHTIRLHTTVSAQRKILGRRPLLNVCLQRIQPPTDGGLCNVWIAIKETPWPSELWLVLA